MDLLQNSDVLKPRVKNAKALVPGCGRGYPVADLFTHGKYLPTGIEISARAAKEANQFVFFKSGLKNTVVKGDFYDEKLFDGGKFDLIYDSAFACCVPRSTFTADGWASRHASLLNPGGYLAMLIFPVPREGEKAPEEHEGPPHFLDPEHVKQMLVEAGFDERPVHYERLPESKQGRTVRGVSNEIMSVWKLKE